MRIKFSTHNLTQRAGWRWLLALLLVLGPGLNVTPVAYAFPAEDPPACEVTGWGADGYGQATPPAGLSDVVAIAAGGEVTGGGHSLALKSDGTVVGWGADFLGQATPPAGLTDVVAISAGAFHHSLALKSDGTVVGWGSNNSGQATPPAGLSDVVAIAAGYAHSLALKSDGTVVGWGNSFGSGAQTPPAGLSDVVAIAASEGHSLALKSDGTVVGWGANFLGQATPPAGLSDVVAIAAGAYHNLALKSDGTVIGWGYNNDGQATPPTGLSDVVAIAAGSYHSLALQCAPAGNTPPTVAADNAGVTVDEGQTAANNGTVSDDDGDTVTLTASVGTVVNNNDGTWSWSFPTSDGPTESQTVIITADDGNDGISETSFELTVNNVAPDVSAISAPADPQPVGAAVSASASFSDPGTGDSHSATWDWGDGSSSAGTVGSGAVGPDSHTYTTPGVYTVQLTVTDDDGGVGQSIYQFVVVYDPSGGFVTGGGWIDSPAGAYPADPALTGKANFGFNSKYQNGANAPSGNTEFQFKVADLKFKSSSYEWLVVAGPHAKFKGVGTINGSGNYGFMLTATDGQINGGGGVDKFRIKIWDKNNGDAIVYDNQMGQGDDSNAGTALGGGSIVIHKGK